MQRIAELIDLRDIIAIIGAIAFIFGVAQVYVPAAWMLGGASFFALGVFGMRK